MPPSAGDSRLLVQLDGRLFPDAFLQQLDAHAQLELPGFIQRNGHQPEVRALLDRIALEAGGLCMDAMVGEMLQGWIEQALHHPDLDAMKRLIWTHSLRTGQLQVPASPEALEFLQTLQASGWQLLAGLPLDEAFQPVLLQHSRLGDLRCNFADVCDTRTPATDWKDCGWILASQPSLLERAEKAGIRRHPAAG